MVIPEKARQDVSTWCGGEFSGEGAMATFVPVTVQGCQMFQQQGGTCWGVDMFDKAENCDAENCPHQAQRNNPAWYLALEGVL